MNLILGLFFHLTVFASIFLGYCAIQQEHRREINLLQRRIMSLTERYESDRT